MAGKQNIFLRPDNSSKKKISSYNVEYKLDMARDFSCAHREAKS